MLTTPDEVKFWATYEFLYGGVYEEIIAKRNGFESAKQMRDAKYAEWKKSNADR